MYTFSLKDAAFLSARPSGVEHGHSTRGTCAHWAWSSAPRHLGSLHDLAHLSPNPERSCHFTSFCISLTNTQNCI